MKRILFTAFLLLLAVKIDAQESRIGFSAWVEAMPAEMDDSNVQTLTNKVDQIITRNSAGATTASSVLFSIRPELVITQSDVVNTGVRPVHVVRAELTLYAVGRMDSSTFGSVVVPLEGNGNSMQTALRSMCNHIRIADPQFTRFIRTAQQKIEEYFIDITPTLLTKADMLAKRQEYDQAVMLLSLVPETVAGYDAIANQMAVYYTDKINLEAEKEINIAKALLVKGDVDGALDILATVDPLSAHAATACKMVKSVKDDMDAQQARASADKAAGYERSMEQKQREFDNQMVLEKMRLDAANKYSAQSTSATVETAKSIGQLLWGVLKK